MSFPKRVGVWRVDTFNDNGADLEWYDIADDKWHRVRFRLSLDDIRDLRHALHQVDREITSKQRRLYEDHRRNG